MALWREKKNMSPFYNFCGLQLTFVICQIIVDSKKDNSHCFVGIISNPDKSSRLGTVFGI